MSLQREAGMRKGVVYALLAAALFGASTPFAKTLLGQVAPVTMAGLLYLGSGIGLLGCYLARAFFQRREESQLASLSNADLPWLAGAILTGGVCGPVLLMLGLRNMPASSASLLLNMEGVLTALLAWFVFRENFDRRILIGMLLIVAAGALLSWDYTSDVGASWGAAAILGACLCWAVDNNLTRKVAGSDALQIATIKGLVAGSVNMAIALSMGQPLPEPLAILGAGAIGFFGYGLSIVLFVLVLRHVGTARTGAYFSAAPFVGAAIALMMPGDSPGLLFWTAAALMAGGIYMHLTESHCHEHAHQALEHVHSHSHDLHHQHDHAAGAGPEPHVHAHQHTWHRHSHPHFPDIHHQHEH